MTPKRQITGLRAARAETSNIIEILEARKERMKKLGAYEISQYYVAVLIEIEDLLALIEQILAEVEAEDAD